MKSNIIDINAYADYKKDLAALTEQLDEVFDDLIWETMVNLACKKKWKKWDDSHDIGDEFTFTEEMLRNTGDKNIDLLWELVEKYDEVKSQLKP
ncbi:hypothetical protein Barb6_00341 [Bacteroidales bacterium Barb6]|nr:hypothetical protein Barb6XT_00547 [Bacteroidales bacterium Barb6XT]OAV73334.1 hypothetical protein Barb6_00341 [Bacteroidales bacterium Barb6]